MHRLFAIGDVHGCFTALQKLVEFAGIAADDLLVTLGDYVNRGPNTQAVLDWLIQRQATGKLVALRGNHEIMMLDARRDEEALQRWIAFGGDATLRSYAPLPGDAGTLADIPRKHWDFLENDLHAYYETERFFFVHANAFPNVPLAEQPDMMLYWEKFDDPPPHESGKKMICGHTSQKSGLPRASASALCIDTWAYGAGWLTCLNVDSGELWQANETGQTRRLDSETLQPRP